jgi:hypothetical protein
LSADEPALSRGGVDDGGVVVEAGVAVEGGAVVGGVVVGEGGVEGEDEGGVEGGAEGGASGGCKGGGGDGIGTLPRKEMGRYAVEFGSQGETSLRGRTDHRQTASLAALPKGGTRGVVVSVCWASYSL